MLRPWELNLTVSRVSSQSIHQQLTHKLIHVIQTGAFAVGTPLPGSRELSQQLGINRKTVIRVYDELVAQGWLYSEDKRGTFVRQQQPVESANFLSSLQALPQQHTTTLHLEQPAYAHHDLSEDTFDLSYPYGDSRLFNLQALVRATRHALIATKRQHPLKLHGLAPLCQAIAHMLNFEQGMDVAAEQLLITPSAQTSLQIVASTLFAKGDYVVLEALHAPATAAAFKKNHAHIQTVKHHQHGVDIDDLEKLCINYPVRAIYVSPECQQPTTWRMSTDNRAQLLKLAKRYDFYVIEDHTHASFQYAKHSLPTLASIDQAERVIYLGSLAHMLNASYRASYIISPQQLHATFVQKLNTINDSHDQLQTLALTELLLSGEVKKQLKRAQKIYLERRDHFCQLLKQALGDAVKCEIPSAGFAVWVQWQTEATEIMLVERMQQAGLTLDTSTVYQHDQTGRISMRIYFAHLNLEEQKSVIKRLKKSILAQPKPLQYAAFG